jgi:hypothetical protein
MKIFKKHRRPRREYRFDIVDHKKALKIWRDSPFKGLILAVPATQSRTRYLYPCSPQLGGVFQLLGLPHCKGIQQGKHML